jgi:hypothetical protein
VTGLVLLVLAGAFAGTLRKPEAPKMATTKYTTAMTRVTGASLKGLPRSFQQFMLRNVTGGKNIWWSIGPTSQMILTDATETNVGGLEIKDSFREGHYLVEAIVPCTSGPAAGASLKMRLKLDDSDLLTDHHSQWVYAVIGGMNETGTLRTSDIIAIPAGNHVISVSVSMYLRAYSVIAADTGKLMVTEL